MANDPKPAGMQIGDVLKSTRTRQGLDIRTVEERTKIRAKYLRALENDDWEVLPGAAYAKGFLRTYARLLGLDADALVDEYRRQVEVAQQTPYGIADGVLERHRRPDDLSNAGPGLGAVLAVAVALGAVLLLVIGVTGGGDAERDRAERREARQERREARREQRRERRQARERERQGQSGPLTLRLVTDAAVHVCLVGDGDRPLIDGQVLVGGSEERFEARRFRLTFPSGYDGDQFRLFVAGDREQLPDAAGPAAYRITAPGGIQPARRPPGPGCP
jgi:cytoskeleton protein RodZ